MLEKDGVGQRSRVRPVAGSVVSQKKSKARRSRSVSRASAGKGGILNGAGVGAGAPFLLQAASGTARKAASSSRRPRGARRHPSRRAGEAGCGGPGDHFLWFMGREGVVRGCAANAPS